VKDLWKKIEAAGDLYEGDYEGWYCVGCEAFGLDARDLLVVRVARAADALWAFEEALKCRALSATIAELPNDAPLADAEAIDDAVIWAVVALAGSKTPGDHHFSGPMPVVQANDPGPLRVVADLCPDKLVARLGGMLPRPAVSGIIMNPAHQPRQVSDFDRRAAAGAVEHLASTHLELAVQLLPNLAISLGVPAEDSYDPGTVGAVERALARTFVAAPVRIAGLLEDAVRFAVANGAQHDSFGFYRSGYPTILFEAMSQITVYTTEPCGYCRVAKALLHKRGVPYEEIALRGGGIASSARAFAEATDGEVLEQAGTLALEMLAHGTTTFEC
jgi:hypothetical protein